MPVGSDFVLQEPFGNEEELTGTFDEYFGSGWRSWLAIWDGEAGAEGGTSGDVTTVSELIVNGGSFQTDSGGWFVGVSLEGVTGVLAGISGVTYFIPGGQGVSGAVAAVAGVIGSVTVLSDFNHFPIYVPGAHDGWFGV